MITNPTSVSVKHFGEAAAFRLYVDQGSSAVCSLDVTAPEPVDDTYVLPLTALLARIPTTAHGQVLKFYVAAQNVNGLSAPVQAAQTFMVGPPVPQPAIVVELL